MQITVSPAAAQRRMGQIVEPREAAHYLLDFELPITLCKPGTKAPIGNGWPQRTWTHDDIDTTFQTHKGLNVGLILGPRSGLIDVEVDGPDGDAELQELFHGDVPVTPMWRSARGPHRLFQWHHDLARVAKSSVSMGSLEVRLGADGKGAQSLLPPSITDGWGRRWNVPLDECSPAPLPSGVRRRIIDTFGQHSSAEADVGHSIAVSHNAVYHAVFHICEDGHSGENGSVRHDGASRVLQAAIKRAIDNTMPGSNGFRNKLLLQFARQLKGIPELAVLDVGQLEPYVREWHRKALPSIETQDFDVTWHDFVVAWNNVKYPAGQGPLDEIYAAGRRQMPACARRFRYSGIRNLIALCRELQLRAGDQPFWLACRPAAAVLTSTPTTVNRWLWKLIHSHVIELITPGTRGRAAEYRYLGD
jgi:hypothetical protein